MKITQTDEKITPFGGFNFCHELFKKSGLPQLIDAHLGKRVKLAGFDYSDIFDNHMAIYLHGGDCAEDVNTHLRNHLNQVRGMSVCSADTILRGIKELSTPIEELTSSSGVVHHFNKNSLLNKLLVKGLLKTGQLVANTGYTLDYDNQVIATQKYDAQRTYKKQQGYQPGIASIGKYIVYIEGRNGNSQAKYQQQQTLQRVFEQLEQHDIRIHRFRADAASYQQDVIDLVANKSQYFYIRAARCASMEHQISQLPASAWKKVRLGTQEMEIADIKQYKPFDQQKTYRLVVSRIRRKDQQSDLFTGDSYTYRAIITNEQQWDNKHIVSFYNKRGGSECNFDVMNNDFGWNNLPCSWLNENTTFMIMTAFYANFYQFMIASFAKKIDWIQANFRLKKFVFRFITVAAKWIKTARQYVLKLYTDKDYSPLTG